MLSSIVEGFLEVLLEIVFQTVVGVGCYYVGCFVVPVVSLGKWSCDDIATTVPRRKLRAAGLYHLRGKNVVLTAEATQVVGFISLGLMVGGGALLWYLNKK